MEEKKITQDVSIILNHDNTATWTFREEGEVSGETYAGTFVFRSFLNPLQVLASGRTYRELLGSESSLATESEKFIAFALSQLIHRIIKSPPFWKTDSMIAGDIPDLNIISLVLDKAITSEFLYKEQLKLRKEKALEKASQAIKNIQEQLMVKEGDMKHGKN